MNLFTCIYCLEQKPAASFTREHVIPKAFGVFAKNLVLNKNQVCKACNDDFGRGVDASLAYASPPGIRRYLKGHKGLVEFPKAVRHKSARGKVKVHIDSEDPLEADDVEFVSTRDGKGFTRTPGLKYWSKKSSKWKFASLSDLERGENILADIGNSIVHISVSDDKNLSRLQTALRQYNPKVTLDLIQTYETLQPDHPVRIAFDIPAQDELVKRAIAKIAFNYLTWVYGIRVALNQGFNPIREYVRYGRLSKTPFINRISNLPIKVGAREAHDRDGHVLLIDWAPRIRGVIAQVALFCAMPYYQEVHLGIYTGVLPAKVASIHYFDFRTKSVLEHTAVPAYTGLWVPNTVR
ncbi:MAG: HNH endonuclease [Dehalococcoidia bacterium]|nr:HNH endonuclease [Dehalococcoidia bacterium]